MQMVTKSDLTQRIKELSRDTADLEPSLLVSATYDGEKKIAVLKFYHLGSRKVHLWYDNTGHKPYCYTKLMPDELPMLKDRKDIRSIEREKKQDLLNDQEVMLTKIVAEDPLAIGGTATEKSIRNLFEVWEADIKYHENYLYDNGLIVGTYYSINNGKLAPHNYKVTEQVELALKNLVWDKITESISGSGDSESSKYITEWAKLLNQPIPDIKRAALDIEVVSEEDRIPDAKMAENEVIAVAIAGSDGVHQAFVLKHDNVELGKNEMEDHIKVTFFDDEKELLRTVFDSVLDYPFIITFNGDDFDMPYLYNRAQNLGISKDEIPIVMQRDAATLKHGVHIDLYRTFSNRSMQIYAFGHKYSEFTLNAVSEALINESKIDFEGGIGQLPLYELARYCHNDARITLKLTSFSNDLLMKLLVVVSRVGRMPVDDISRLGVSQWIRSMIYFEHRRKNALIPRREELELKSQASTTAIIKDKKYRGGLVVEPKAGVHFNVAVLDFASLYPSIIKVHNLSYETVRCVHDDCKSNAIPETEHWACKKRKGIESLLIGSLRDLRVNYYKHLAKEKSLSKEEKELYNIISQALKVILNASYGVMGAEIFPLYCLPVAEATASIGRYTITKTIEKCTDLGIQVVYGDSVIGDRFVTILNENGLIEVKKIFELFGNCKRKFIREDGKEVAIPAGIYALSVNTSTKRASFEPISAVIRHKVNKNIFRVNQKWGETVVTEDHSLIIESDRKLIPAKPSEVKDRELIRVDRIPKVRGIKRIDLNEILKDIQYSVIYKGRTKTIKAHTDGKWVWFGWTNRKKSVKVKRYLDIESKEFESLCRLMGAYIAEGSSSTRETSRAKFGASIASSDVSWLEVLKHDYYQLFNNATIKIIPSTARPRHLVYVTGRGVTSEVDYIDATHKLQMMNEISAVLFKALCGQKSSSKKIPSFIFHVPDKYKLILLENMIKGDGSKKFGNRYTEDYSAKNFRYETKSLNLVGGLSVLLLQLDIKYGIEYRRSKNTYRISTASKYKKSRPVRITKEDYQGYVYDLTVKNSHTFVDSCGNIVLKNTDSLFLKGPSTAQIEAISVWAKQELRVDLDLDKQYRYVAFSERKKNYLGVMMDGSVDIKGLTGKKSHTPQFIRDAFYAIVDILSRVNTGADFEDARERIKKIVKDNATRLKSKQIPLTELTFNVMVGKAPREYKKTIPQHIRAAELLEKAGKREVKAGDIISFIKTTAPPGVKPVELAKSDEIDTEKYLEYMESTFDQILSALGYEFDVILGASKLEDFFFNNLK